MNEFIPAIIEKDAEWRSDDLQNSTIWIEYLSQDEIEEINSALKKSLEYSKKLLDIKKEHFPLPHLQVRLNKISNTLMNGRGFSLIRGIPAEKYSKEELTRIFWGLGIHLGKPWAQNNKGHLVVDVTDQGKSISDTTSRGYELGEIALSYHTDAADVIGLLCLQKAYQGGLSTICNIVAIHNDMVRQAPDLIAALYKPQPFDLRGEHAADEDPYYMVPVFTNFHERLFVHYIRDYILESQFHEYAPRIHPEAERAMQFLDELTLDPQYELHMDLEPGDMQFINNYHVLHGRTSYIDNKQLGYVRHLKRLWLKAYLLQNRPPFFEVNINKYWDRTPIIESDLQDL